MPVFLGSLLCWLGLHFGGSESLCAALDQTGRHYLWCKRTWCQRCGKRLTLRPTGVVTKASSKKR